MKKNFNNMFDICYNKIDNKKISKFFKNFIIFRMKNFSMNMINLYMIINYDNCNENNNLVLSN